MSVYDKAYELARAVKDSEEYKAYQMAKAAVEGQKIVAEMLRDYKRLQMLVEASVISGRQPDEKTAEEHRRLCEIIEMHKPVRDFLNAEHRLLTLANDIYRIVCDALDLWDYDVRA